MLSRAIFPLFRYAFWAFSRICLKMKALSNTLDDPLNFFIDLL